MSSLLIISSWQGTSLPFGYVAPYRIVIGLSYGTVYRTVVRPQVLADEYVVYPKIEFVLVVGDSQSASRLGESVIQILRYDAVGV